MKMLKEKMQKLKVLPLALLSVLMLSACNEREGTVKVSDCREQIIIKEKSIDAITKTFTCEYRRTVKGKLLRGYCVHIDYDSNGQCKASYTYFKKQEDVCLDKKNPILREDDMCYPY